MILIMLKIKKICIWMKTVHLFVKSNDICMMEIYGS